LLSVFSGEATGLIRPAPDDKCKTGQFPDECCWVGLLAIQKLGRNRDTPRLWLESQRLETLGFSHGVPLNISNTGDALTIVPAVLGNNHVSSRGVAGRRRPIIDLESASLLAGLAEYSEVKIIASFERIQVTPSHRAFAVHRARNCQPPFRVVEVFAGGGTMTAAIHKDERYVISAGIEVDPLFADEWQAQNPAATIIQADVRRLHSSELPEFDVLVGGIPCTCHSNLGRAKKGLARKPESGEVGDLFIPVLGLISERMPAAALFENVPSFGTSLAGGLMTTTLQRLGYHVFTTTLQPNADWGEIEDRRRWLLVATLDRPFCLGSPGMKCATSLRDYLDPPDPARDEQDCRRIQRTIDGVRAHNARHRELGHGFGFTVVDGSEFSIPTIPKSYYKINSGPFLKTPYGLRLLRHSEVERIHGVRLLTAEGATALQILGQGVQTRLFSQIFRQLADHLG
jgi:DNA (cytosine-5)-methyltransferase 1